MSLEAVAAERVRQQELKAAGVLRYTAADPDCPELLRMTALTEELGEVARAIHDGEPKERLREELVQLAAVAVAWTEAL